MVAQQQQTSIEGVVERVNERGVVLAGRDGGWLNWSKYAEAVVVPQVGEHVLLTLDRSGYVRELTVRETPHQAAQNAPERPRAAPAVSQTSDSQSVRLAALTQAVRLCTAGGIPANVGDVLDVARELAAWVTGGA